MSEEERDGRGLTRRGLIRGLATGVAAAGAAPALLAVPEAPIDDGLLPVRVVVNGVERSGRFAPRVTLADALRESWGLTGTKVGCDRGACGSCTVLMDGVAVPSCSVLVHDADGRKVTTIEGLGSPERLSNIQREFLDADGLQCGFCTSGMVVSASALAAARPHPSREEILRAVSGNTCRCAAYAGVVAACMNAGREKNHG